MASKPQRRSHLRALAIVSRISLTLGAATAAGCIEHAPALDVFDSDVEDGGCDGCTSGDAEHDAEHDAERIGDVLADADPPDGQIDSAVAADMGPDATTDAAVECPGPEDPEAWQACCEALGWPNTDPSCTPWGPPMPPRLLA